MRGDLTKTWVHRGAAGWMVHPDANKSGEYTVGSDGVLQLLIREGAKENFLVPMRAVFYLDNLLSDDYISHVDYVAEWNVTDEGTYHFSWTLSCDGTVRNEANTSSAGTSGDHTPVNQVKVVDLILGGTDSSWANLLYGDRYVRFPTLDVFGSGKTAKVRIDEAMCDLATRSGLAVSTTSSPVGVALDDLWDEKTNAAALTDRLAKLHAAPLDFGYWDDQSFRVKPIDRRPMKPHEVVVVGGGLPGLVSWDVRPQDDDKPDYVAVYFRNKDDPAYPEGAARVLWMPHTPPDRADVRVDKVDFSSLIMPDAAAMAAGAQLLGASGLPYELPSGVVWATHPEFADSSYSAGNNTDPTSSYAQLSPDGPVGTVTCGFVSGSGFAGSNTPIDPTCLELDGVDDNVDWGDLAECDFGTGAFAFARWFRLDETGRAQVLDGKYAAGVGWLLWVNATNNLCAYVGESATKYRIAADAHELVAGVWYCGGFTWSGTTGGTLTVYLSAQSDHAIEVSVGAFTGAGISNAASLKEGAA